MQIRRGDIILVDFDPTEGSEQRGTRPAVVVQNDAGNQAAPTTIVAPLTTSYDPENIVPYEAEIPATTTDVDEDSVALCNQLRTVSVADRVSANFGSVSSDVMRDIEQAVRVSLDL